MSEQLEIVNDNDYIEFAGPIRGRNPDGELDLYHGTDVEGMIVANVLSNTPIGGLTYASSEIGSSGKYPVLFEGAAITAALSANPSGTKFYRVIRSTGGNFRIVDEITYLHSRPSD